MKNDEDGLRECMGILADLFDESMKKEKELLHKFFVYQLNVSALYQSYARSFSYGIPSVSILLNVGDRFDQKIGAIAFNLESTYSNKIVISTADEVREGKN